MIRKVSVSLAALAAMGIAGAASAQVTKTNTVEVNINVLPEVSFWFDHTNVSLELGTGPENLDTFESGMNWISNVPSTVTAAVTGSLPTPTPDTDGGVYFFIFPDVEEADAINAIQDNSRAPAGAGSWNYDSIDPNHQDHEQMLYAAAVTPTISNIPWTYGASTPGDLPLPDDWDLTVTYTMTED